MTASQRDQQEEDPPKWGALLLMFILVYGLYFLDAYGYCPRRSTPAPTVSHDPFK